MCLTFILNGCLSAVGCLTGSLSVSLSPQKVWGNIVQDGGKAMHCVQYAIQTAVSESKHELNINKMNFKTISPISNPFDFIM